MSMALIFAFMSVGRLVLAWCIGIGRLGRIPFPHFKMVLIA